MAKKLELYRESLNLGDLYYLDEKIKMKGRFSDSLILWKEGPGLAADLGHKDNHIDTVYMNVHNPFVLLEVIKDEEQFSTYWYRILTKNGQIGWFALDDEDIQLLHLCFREAEIPDQE